MPAVPCTISVLSPLIAAARCSRQPRLRGAGHAEQQQRAVGGERRDRELDEPPAADVLRRDRGAVRLAAEHVGGHGPRARAATAAAAAGRRRAPARPARRRRAARRGAGGVASRRSRQLPQHGSPDGEHVAQLVQTSRPPRSRSGSASRRERGIEPVAGDADVLAALRRAGIAASTARDSSRSPRPAQLERRRERVRGGRRERLGLGARQDARAVRDRAYRPQRARPVGVALAPSRPRAQPSWTAGARSSATGSGDRSSSGHGVASGVAASSRARGAPSAGRPCRSRRAAPPRPAGRAASTTSVPSSTRSSGVVRSAIRAASREPGSAASRAAAAIADRLRASRRAPPPGTARRRRTGRSSSTSTNASRSSQVSSANVLASSSRAGGRIGAAQPLEQRPPLLAAAARPHGVRRRPTAPRTNAQRGSRSASHSPSGPASSPTSRVVRRGDARSSRSGSELRRRSHAPRRRELEPLA